MAKVYYRWRQHRETQYYFMKAPDIISVTEKHPPSVIKSVYHAKDFMNTHIDHHLVLKSLALRAGTNEYTLKKGFKDILKTSVYQYLLKIRMEYALQLITGTNKNETEIARLCGYKTLSGFVTTFHKYHGNRPGVLRKYL